MSKMWDFKNEKEMCVRYPNAQEGEKSEIQYIPNFSELSAGVIQTPNALKRKKMYQSGSKYLPSVEEKNNAYFLVLWWETKSKEFNVLHMMITKFQHKKTNITNIFITKL